MTRLRYLPHVLSVTALVIALTGVTPAGAVNAVKRALFAKNAGAVDGISASRTPKAGQLLPLDAQGRVPAGVLPTGGARGERGPQGPQGSAGPAGPIDVTTTQGRTTAIPVAGGGNADVSRVILGPGKWLLLGAGSGLFDPATGSTYMGCSLIAGAKTLDHQVLRLGADGIGALAIPFALNGAVDIAATTTARVNCGHDVTVAGNLRIEGAHITAVRIDRFTEKPGDGT